MPKKRSLRGRRRRGTIRAVSIQLHLRRFIGWVMLVAAAAAGGWLVGRQLVTSVGALAGSQPPDGLGRIAAHSLPVFAAESPRGRWMAQVKQAAAVDFPRLADEWREVFSEDAAYDDGWPPNAVNAFRWLMGMWLVKDMDGFLKVVASDSFGHGDWAAQTLVQLMPEKAAELLSGPAGEGLDRWFVGSAAIALAEQHPALYLKLDPDNTLDLTPHTYPGAWINAIICLAKADAPAAGNACLRWKDENNSRTVYEALLAVAAAWKPGDPPIAAWADAIKDSKLRNIATHAWLSTLAGKDPKAALAALYATELKWEEGIFNDASLEIARQLAKTNLPEAFKLMKEMESFYAKHPEDNDPFSETSADGIAENSRNPFARFHPDHSDDPASDNHVQFTILSEAIENLPGEPGQLLGALRKLFAGMGDGDTAWQRGVEGEMVRQMSERWSVESCLAAAGLWLSEHTVAPDDPTLRKLATRAATADPKQALAALAQFPEPARAFFVGEIIKHLPALELSRNIGLFSQLAPEQWNSELGEALGRNAEEFAPLIGSFPVATTFGARRAFMGEWAEHDPEAAAQWLAASPADDAAGPAAAGLAEAWVQYDRDAAAAWADTLPAGPVRDGAADSLVHWLAMGHSADAWHWTATIGDPAMRAKAFDRVATYWKNKAPDDFRAAHNDARRTAGLPPYEYDRKEDPFE